MARPKRTTFSGGSALRVELAKALTWKHDRLCQRIERMSGRGRDCNHVELVAAIKDDDTAVVRGWYLSRALEKSGRDPLSAFADDDLFSVFPDGTYTEHIPAPTGR